jgi:hypothetical protein
MTDSVRCNLDSSTIAGFKAGYDTGHCLASEQQNAIERATEQNGVALCEAEGGTVTGIVISRPSAI